MKKIFLVFFFLGISLLIAGCVKQQQPATGNQTENPAGTQDTSTLTKNEQELLKYPELAAFIESYQQIGKPAKRPDYLPSIVFSKLPPFPKDFYSMRFLVENGKFTDTCRIGSEYYLQPEFYPRFEASGVPLYQHPPTDRWGAFGLGSYPSEILILSPRQTQFETCFFMFTSWLVQTYQGMMFTVGFPKEGEMFNTEFPDLTKNVTQDPSVVSKYFDVEVTPREVLLEPNFPIFEQGWAKRIKVTIRTKNPPPGKYLVGIGTAGPSKEQADDWQWQYRERYTDGATRFADIGRPWFGVFIHIT